MEKKEPQAKETKASRGKELLHCPQSVSNKSFLFSMNLCFIFTNYLPKSGLLVGSFYKVMDKCKSNPSNGTTQALKKKEYLSLV